MGCRYQRPHFSRRIGPRCNAQFIDARNQLFNQGICRGLANRHGHRNCHATFASRPVCSPHQGIDRLIHVGIRHNDHVVFRTTKRLTTFALRGCGFIDVFGNRGRPDKADRGDVRIKQKRINRFLVALNNVEYAIRKTGLGQPFRQQKGCGRIAFGRFEDKAVTACKCYREHPHRHHGREVERRDTGNDTQRLTHRMAVDLGADIFGEFTLEQLRRAGCKFDNLDPAGDFAQRIGQNLAMFGGDCRGQFFGTVFKNAKEFIEDTRPAKWCGIGPFIANSRSRFNRRTHFGFGCKINRAALCAGCRIKDSSRTTGFTGDALAIDVMGDLGRHGVPPD